MASSMTLAEAIEEVLGTAFSKGAIGGFSGAITRGRVVAIMASEAIIWDAGNPNAEAHVKWGNGAVPTTYEGKDAAEKLKAMREAAMNVLKKEDLHEEVLTNILVGMTIEAVELYKNPQTQNASKAK